MEFERGGIGLEVSLSGLTDNQLYPKAAPILSIEEPENLTPNHVATLSKLINDKAKELSSRKDPAPFIFDVSLGASLPSLVIMLMGRSMIV